MMSINKWLTYFRRSLVGKLILIFVFLTVFLQGVTLFWILTHEEHAAEDDIIIRGNILADSLIYSAQNAIFIENHKLLQEIAESVIKNDEVGAVMIYGADGHELSAVRKKTFHDHVGLLEGGSAAAIRGKLNTVQSREIVKASDYYEFIKPVFMSIAPENEAVIYYGLSAEQDKKEKVIGFITILMDKSSVYQRIKSSTISIGTAVLTVIIGGVVLISLIVRKVTVPLHILSREVTEIGKGESINKLSINSRDEIGRFAESFNIMWENLQAKDAQKRLLEDNLLNARKMEAIGTLAGGMAHDFKNVLATIMAFVDYIRHIEPGQRQCKTHPYILESADIVETEINKASNIITQLLSVGRRSNAKFAVFDINVLLRSVVSLYCKVMKNVEFKMNLFPDECLICGDRELLEQAISNMIINSQEAIKDRGEIHVSSQLLFTEEMYLSEGVKKKKTVHVQIFDTGTGIPEDIIHMVFDPFFTTKQRNTKKGIGLGLAMVYGIIKEHGGDICVESQLNIGTTFTITFPAATTEI